MSNMDKLVKACGWGGHGYQVGSYHHYSAKWACCQAAF